MGISILHGIVYFVDFSVEEWSDCCGTSEDAQPSAGVEEGRGDSPQNQSHATRPAEQAEGEREALETQYDGA